MEKILERIRERGREFEKDLDMDFLITISHMYDQFFEDMKKECIKSNVLIIETDNYDAQQVFKLAVDHLSTLKTDIGVNTKDQ